MNARTVPLLLLLLPLVSVAGQVEIVDARVATEGGDSYRFDVTLRHADSGWDHYADSWQVLMPDGRQVAERVLVHPHVNEQPFTRSLGGVAINPGTPYVLIRAHDKVHGYSEQQFRVSLPGG